MDLGVNIFQPPHAQPECTYGWLGYASDEISAAKKQAEKGSGPAEKDIWATVGSHLCDPGEKE